MRWRRFATCRSSFLNRLPDAGTDKRILKLMRGFLTAGVLADGLVMTDEGPRACSIKQQSGHETVTTAIMGCKISAHLLPPQFTETHNARSR